MDYFSKTSFHKNSLFVSITITTKQLQEYEEIAWIIFETNTERNLSHVNKAKFSFEGKSRLPLIIHQHLLKPDHKLSIVFCHTGRSLSGIGRLLDIFKAE